MTREAFTQMIHWDVIAWIVCIIGVGSALPQLIKIVFTHQVRDLSLLMFWVIGVSQAAYSLDGYFKKNAMVMTCMGLGALLSAAIIVLIYHWRGRE